LPTTISNIEDVKQLIHETNQLQNADKAKRLIQEANELKKILSSIADKSK